MGSRPLTAHIPRAALVLVLVAAGASCPTACTPALAETVGAGAARLSVRDAAALMLLVLDDDTCGFAAPIVQASAAYDGAPGAMGTQTLRVEGCEMALPTSRRLSENCDGEPLDVEGTVRIDATWVTAGLLTGNPEGRVAPFRADASTLAITAEFDGFIARAGPADPIFLEHHNGRLSFSITPLLAALYETPGICGYPTPHLRVDNLVYTDAKMTLFSDQAAPLAFEVVESNFSAQVGPGLTHENSIEGTLTVYDTPVSLPPEDDGGLNPEYDRATFLASYQSCIDEEADRAPLIPLSYECPGFDRLFALSTSQQLVGHVEAAVAALRADPACGFEGTASHRTVTGAPGSPGEVRDVVEECSITFDAERALDADCVGETLMGEGVLRIGRAERVASGLRADDEGIVPTSDTPTAYVLENISFDGVHVAWSNQTESLRIDSGRVDATLVPRSAAATDGRCSVRSRVSRVERLVVEDVGGQLLTTRTRANVSVPLAELTAVRGRWDASVNALDGTLVLDAGRGRVTHDITATGGLLASRYTQAGFDATWQCADDLALPPAFICSTEP